MYTPFDKREGKKTKKREDGLFILHLPTYLVSYPTRVYHAYESYDTPIFAQGVSQKNWQQALSAVLGELPKDLKKKKNRASVTGAMEVPRHGMQGLPIRCRHLHGGLPKGALVGSKGLGWAPGQYQYLPGSTDSAFFGSMADGTWEISRYPSPPWPLLRLVSRH